MLTSLTRTRESSLKSFLFPMTKSTPTIAMKMPFIAKICAPIAGWNDSRLKASKSKAARVNKIRSYPSFNPYSAWSNSSCKKK